MFISHKLCGTMRVHLFGVNIIQIHRLFCPLYHVQSVSKLSFIHQQKSAFNQVNQMLPFNLAPSPTDSHHLRLLAFVGRVSSASGVNQPCKDREGHWILSLPKTDSIWVLYRYPHHPMSLCH